MNAFRLQRVSALITETIGLMISREEIKDTRISTLLSVSDVEVSKDLQFAKIGISGYVNEAELESAVEAFNRSTAFIQSRLGKAMKTRLTPKLNFYVDHKVEDAFKMTKRIEDLIRDEKPGNTGGSEA